MTDNPSPFKGFFTMVLFGGIFMLAGAFIVMISLDVIEVSDENFNAPRWVVAFAGGFFIIAGMLPMLQGLKELSGGEPPWLRFANQLVTFIFLLLLAIPFNWVAFGSGEREFSSEGSIGPISIIAQGVSGGRCVFGIAAMLLNILLIYILVQTLWKMINPNRE